MSIISGIFLIVFCPIINYVISSPLKDDLKNNIDCYFQTLKKNNNNDNSIICSSGYYRLPDFFTDEEAEEDDLLILRSENESYSEKWGGFYCCPVENSSDNRLGVGTIMLWPNEGKSTWSRAVMSCHATDIPGLDSIKYLLYTKKNGGLLDFEELVLNAPGTILNSGFIRHAPVKIIIHGFMSSPFIGPAPALRAAYSTLSEPINVIAVHWEALANLVTMGDGVCYDIAAQGTKFVGRKTANLIEFLVKRNLTTLDKVHILGHSLGSHCAGFAGKYLKIGKISRITGFDPARPHFEGKGPTERLDFTDAEFVDVIHTATRQWKVLNTLTSGLLPFPVGLRDALGHKDFYPNKGTHQPGCILQLKKLPVLCSHSRSYAYYADSIMYRDERVFIADECQNLDEVETGKCTITTESFTNEDDVMGEYTSKINNTRKLYLVKTNSRTPFAKTLVAKR